MHKFPIPSKTNQPLGISIPFPSFIHIGIASPIMVSLIPLPKTLSNTPALSSFPLLTPHFPSSSAIAIDTAPNHSSGISSLSSAGLSCQTHFAPSFSVLFSCPSPLFGCWLTSFASITVSFIVVVAP